MTKRTKKVKYCLLGYGYASLIVYHRLLEKTDNDDILILQNKKSKKIFTIEHEETDFSPLPIFPVEESELYNSALFENVPQQKPISVSFSDLVNFKVETLQINKGSLADFMISNQGIDQNLCLGLKQWGGKMLRQPYDQVQSKIKRHYISKNGNTRLGYIQGKSLYKYAIDNLAPNIFNYSDLSKIDIRKKEIYLDNGIITYEKLVSTIPLHYLFGLCDLSYDHDDAYADAYFCFFKYDAGFQENQMVYDCDFKSDIIRIFSISDTFLLAQIRGEKYGNVKLSNIESRVRELAPNIQNLRFAKELYLPMCYPLAMANKSKTRASLDELEKNDILPFGRFGSWEYSDLHELQWSLVDEL